MTALRIEAPECSDAEWRVREDLAACFRLVQMFGWDDLVATHISARVPGEDAFLLNPFGLLFEEITASSLVKVDLDGNILGKTEYRANQAGFVIHSAVHLARHDAACVMHLHTRDGVAVSALEEGLLPLNQSAMLVAADVAFHDYEGVATNEEERVRIANDLGNKNLMLLRNHGTLAVGPTIAECFGLMYYLEWACTVQVRTLSMGRPIHDAAPEAIASVTAVAKKQGTFLHDILWPAVLRRLERFNPGWKS